MKMKSASLKKCCWVLLLLLLTVPAWATGEEVKGLDTEQGADYTYTAATTGVLRTLEGNDDFPDKSGVLYNTLSDDYNVIKVTGTGEGAIPAFVFGGVSIEETADATHNTVTVTGGTVARWVIGGHSTSSANYNKVTVSGSAQIGESDDDDNDDESVPQGIEGGVGAGNGSPTGNHVIIGGDAVIGSENAAEYWSKVAGGYGLGTGAVQSNTVEIQGGEINVRVVGGEGNGSGNVTGNRVIIAGGTLNGTRINGGLSVTEPEQEGSSGSGNTSSNVVDIQASVTTGEIHGGEVDADHTASENRVRLWGKGNTPITIGPKEENGTLDIAGGVVRAKDGTDGGAAANNTVGIYGAVQFEDKVDLYGGKVGNNGSPDGNRLVLALNDKSLLPLKVNTLAGFAS
ncbi:MAG: hypothetical protein LBO82_08515, partial [Synergistaceae bacterium]|nr:hypothetical protein [Synergistaceae bacterium]